MKQILIYFAILSSVSVLCSNGYGFAPSVNHVDIKYYQDTCIIQGMLFNLITEEAPQELEAIIRNEKLEILGGNTEKKFRVIRYVFSILRYEKYALVRNYGNLISYPVIQSLKESVKGDRFYFEDIIVVDNKKEIQNNLVKPIIIERVK